MLFASRNSGIDARKTVEVKLRHHLHSLLAHIQHKQGTDYLG